MLAGVDNRIAAGYFTDGRVKPSVVTDIVFVCPSKTRRQRRSGQQRHEAVAVNSSAQTRDAERIDPGPAAEPRVADLAPEIAFSEWDSASAPFIVDKAPVPQMNDLPHGGGAGQFADEALEQRAPTASKTRQVDHPRYGPSCGHRGDSRARCGAIAGCGSRVAIASWSSPYAVASCRS